MNDSRWRRGGTVLATMLAAGSVGAVEINSSLAPLTLATNAQQLIQNVWIGSPSKNPYKGINDALGQLGFSDAAYGQQASNILHHGPIAPHEHHFHIDLRPPVRKPLPQGLLVGTGAAHQVTPELGEAHIANAQALLDQFKADLNLTQGVVTMFVPDMPNLPPQDVPVMIAQANQAQAANATAIRTIGVCFVAPNQNYSGDNG